MIKQANIKIPYPKKIGFISFDFRRTVKFSFDMFSVFLFHEGEGIDKIEDLTKWQETRGKYDLFVYGAFYAAQSYAIQHRKNFDLEMGKFSLGLAQLKKEEVKVLIDAWRRSQDYGSAKLPGKKKAMVKS